MTKAVIIEKPTLTVVRTIAETTTISKGTLLKLSGTNTAFASTDSISGASFGGIAAEDHIAGQGITTISAHLDGVFDITNNSVVINTGSRVSQSGADMIRLATAGDLLAGSDIGVIEEEGAANDVVRVRLRGF